MLHFKVLTALGNKEYFIIFIKIISYFRARFDDSFDKPKKKGINYLFTRPAEGRPGNTKSYMSPYMYQICAQNATENRNTFFVKNI